MNPWIAKPLSIAASLGLAGVTLAGLAITGCRVTAAQNHPPYAPPSRAGLPTPAAPSPDTMKVENFALPLALAGRHPNPQWHRARATP